MVIHYTAISHVLLDIEGTTCPVSFVADTLFPYALQHLQEFLEQHHQEPAIQDLLWQLADHQRNAPTPTDQPNPSNSSLVPTRGAIAPTPAPVPLIGASDSANCGAPCSDSPPDVGQVPNFGQAPKHTGASSHHQVPPVGAFSREGDGSYGSQTSLSILAHRPMGASLEGHADRDGNPLMDDSTPRYDGTALTMTALPALVAYAKMLIQSDVKVTPLKDLQGRIWSDGYAKGELIAPLFADVPACLQEWNDQGIALAVYSSGSISAQKLLYQFSNAGDIRGLFHHWFDTHLGPKHAPASYQAICQQMGAHPDQVLFISDSPAELEAAQTAGLQVLSSDRPGNPQQTGSSTFPAIQDFHGLTFSLFHS
jgi:2,3-diketo-5-methylthio-1-phosphopentane phosphatase